MYTAFAGGNPDSWDREFSATFHPPSMSSSSSASASDSDRPSSPAYRRKRQRTIEHLDIEHKKGSDDSSTGDSEHSDIEASDSDSDDSDAESDSGADEEADAPVLSHAEKRRQKKKEQRTSKASAAAVDESGKKGKEKVKNTADLPPSKIPKRQNSVWVGNLSFKTTPESLRSFFEGVGEITRIHMPTKMAAGGPDGQRPRKENRGLVPLRPHSVCPYKRIYRPFPPPVLRMSILPRRTRRPSRSPCLKTR